MGQTRWKFLRIQSDLFCCILFQACIDTEIDTPNMFSRLASRQTCYETVKETTQSSDLRAKSKFKSHDSGICEKVIDCVISTFSDNWQINKSAHFTVINHDTSCQEDGDNLRFNTMSNDLEAIKGHQLFTSTPLHYSVVFVV